MKVPLRGTPHTGYISELKETSEFPRAHSILHVISEGEMIPEDLFELALWMSKYYCTPLSKVMKVILPSSVRQNIAHKEQYAVMRAKTKEDLREECIRIREEHPSQAKVLEVMLMVKKEILLTELMEKAGVSRSPIDTLYRNGWLEIALLRLDRSPVLGEYFKTEAKTLNPDQKKALEAISESVSKGTFSTHLLYGVTGSGKTEVYLQAIEKALAQNKGTIMLVPEISLTSQTIERLKSRFDEKIAILHHRLSAGERFDEWHRLKRKEALIAIGARSALFCPVRDLGLIIVDEEHDGAYKQSEEMPCYHARDTAVMRGKIANATVVLGSATPSLESHFNVERGKYHLSKLVGRADAARMPRVSIVDMKKEYEKQKGYTSFSSELIDAIKIRLEKGEQTILFLNRRGYHTSLQCLACGFQLKCSACDLPLTFHLGENKLACHLCGYLLSPPPKSCPSCKRPDGMKFKGVGTEQIERALHALFPEVRTLRIDSDTTKHKGSHETLFRAFSTGKSDVLIGTQMVAKGLHFPNVTLVAILNSDSPLQIPDFRASEQVFSLITQVAGRSGRGVLEGHVIIQTQMPEHPVIQMAAAGDFESFYRSEMETRKHFSYPPYTHLVKFLFSGLDVGVTERSGLEFRKQLAPLLGKAAVAHPLVPSGHPKIKDRYRFQFLVRSVAVYPVTEAVTKLLTSYSCPRDVKLTIDIDPLYTYF